MTERCPSCAYDGKVIVGVVRLEYGWQLWHCPRCCSSFVRAIPWVSQFPEDYVPGHPDNAWGAF